MKQKRGNDDSSRDDQVSLDGVVSEALPGTLFKVTVGNGVDVLCTLSGKLRINKIKILPGDHVKVVVSPYDLTRGRIAWRS